MINLYWDSILMIAFDICDWNGNAVVRSLKVDFTGKSVLMGEAGTNLFDSNFDAHEAGVKVLNNPDSTTAELANETAQWLYFEMSRPIILKEWITLFYQHREYVLADTNHCLSWSDSQHKKRRWLGAPTRAAIVHPITERKSLLK